MKTAEAEAAVVIMELISLLSNVQHEVLLCQMSFLETLKDTE